MNVRSSTSSSSKFLPSHRKTRPLSPGQSSAAWLREFPQGVDVDVSLGRFHRSEISVDRPRSKHCRQHTVASVGQRPGDLKAFANRPRDFGKTFAAFLVRSCGKLDWDIHSSRSEMPGQHSKEETRNSNTPQTASVASFNHIGLETYCPSRLSVASSVSTTRELKMNTPRTTRSPNRTPDSSIPARACPRRCSVETFTPSLPARSLYG